MGQFTGFSRQFSVSQKFHDSLEGLLTSPLNVAGRLPAGAVGRRGRPVRHDAATNNYIPLIHSRVKGVVDNSTDRLQLSAYDQLTAGATISLILFNGSFATATINEVVPPVYDPVSTLQSNIDSIRVTTTANLSHARYVVLGNVTSLQAADGIIYEDSSDRNCAVALFVPGANIDHVFGADIPAIANQLGYKVRGSLVFFQGF